VAQVVCSVETVEAAYWAVISVFIQFLPKNISRFHFLCYQRFLLSALHKLIIAALLLGRAPFGNPDLVSRFFFF
jgi:hypothetical protein